MKKKFPLLIFTLILSFGFLKLEAQFSWSQLKEFGGNPRYGVVSFVVGDTAYVGLGRNTTTYFSDFWKYNPSTDKWTKIADFAGGARSNAVAFCLNNKGYVATGVNGSTKYKDLWEYDPATNQWTKKADFGGTARSAAIAFTVDNKAYVGTGTDGTEKKDLWEYDPSQNIWTSKADLTSDARQAASAFAINGRGYICAGVTYSSGTMMTNDVYEYNPVTNTWTEKSFAESHLARTGAATFVMNNQAYVCGGSGKKDLWEYTPSTNSWVKLADFGLASETNRSNATGFSIKGMGIVTCGYYMVNVSTTVMKNDVWAYAPPMPPKAPSNLAASGITSNQVSLTWQNNSQDATEFIIEKSIGDNLHYEIRSSSNANPNNITFSDLLDSTTYFYRARAVNSAGSSEYSNEVSVTTRFAKPILSVIPYSPRSIIVLWSHNTQRNYKYYIERSDNDNAYFALKDSAENIKEWMDTTLSNGNKYYYRLYVKFGSKKLYSNFNYAITGEQGSWKSLAEFPSYNMSGFSFMIGRKFYSGIKNSTKIELYEYDADKNSWAKKSDFPGDYRESPKAFMVNNKGYVGLGYTWVNSQLSYFQDMWEYDPVANTWKKIADFPGAGRQSATTLTINDMGYVGFGYRETNLKDLWQYNPANNVWTQMADCPVELNNPTSFRLGNIGYFGFGWSKPVLYSFNPDLNQWTKKNDFTDLLLDISISSSQFAFNIGEKAYLMASKPNSFWEYDPQNDTWVRKNGYNNLQGPMNSINLAESDGEVALFHPGVENVIGSSSSGTSTQKLLVFDPAGLAVPTKLRIAESSKKAVTLKWFHDGTNIKYMIERFDYSQYKWKVFDSTQNGVKSYTDTTLEENRTYQYRILAKSIDKVSSYTNVVFFRTGFPSLVSASRVVSKFKDNNLIIYSPPSIYDCADGYYLERSDESNPSEFIPIDTFDYTQQVFTDKNLTIGKWYYYRIKAFNKFGTTVSGSIRGKAGDVCIFNGSINTDKATIIDEYGYDVEFNHCSNSKLTIYPETAGNKILLTMDEINIYRTDTIYIYNGPSNTSPLLGKISGKTLPDQLFCGNNPDGCLTIYSKANCTWDGAFYSGFKATVTSDKYFPPSHLKAVSTLSNIKINWNDNSANENYFIIERSEGDSNNFIRLDSISANVTTYTDLNVSSNQQYFYKVQLKSGNEYSGYSNIQGTMLLPASPAGLSLQLNRDGRLRFKWTDNATNESKYIIYRSYNDSLHYAPIDTVKANVDSFLFKPQIEYVYYYQIKAVNLGGVSGGTKSIPFILLKTPVLYNPYVNNNNSVQLSWSDNSYAETGYVVERSDNDTLHFTIKKDLSINANYYLDENLDLSKNYFYRIKAVHTFGESLYSVNKSQIFVTDVENFKSDIEIGLFPNPASGLIYLKNNSRSDLKKYRIFNAQGSMVKESGNENLTGTETAINISGFSPGVYIMKVELDNMIKILRFVVQ